MLNRPLDNGACVHSSVTVLITRANLKNVAKFQNRLSLFRVLWCLLGLLRLFMGFLRILSWNLVSGATSHRVDSIAKLGHDLRDRIGEIRRVISKLKNEYYKY